MPESATFVRMNGNKSMQINQNLIKVGILFGGPSREREISFAGGRTVYDNLDKSIFEPIPIFIDSNRKFILLDWQYIYKGTIRDFYPPVAFLPPSPNHFQIYVDSLQLEDESYQQMIEEVGREVSLQELPQLIDVAFLALHGYYGEDGQLQGLLDSLQIPYTGSGVRASAIGMHKGFQKKLMKAGGFACPEVVQISKETWERVDHETLFEEIVASINWPLVIRPANQGSSIGVTILDESAGFPGFTHSINKAFFRKSLSAKDWNTMSDTQQIEWIRELGDIREGLGFPIDLTVEGKPSKTIYHPENFLGELREYFSATTVSEVLLESHHTEEEVIVEAFIKGKEFSCIVIRNLDGGVVALPPTEIVKGGEVFDYRSKYLPGLSRKETPIHLPDDQIEAIRQECERLYSYLEFNTYARIDGFITEDQTIFLNDPNTTSGMLPSSFFFHQAAEIGLNPSQFLTFILFTSIEERMEEALISNRSHKLFERLKEVLQAGRRTDHQKQKIAVILGGYSFERHISVESGRNVFEKLSSSEKYEPIPVFLAGNASDHQLYQIPINLLLKDNADDIRDRIFSFAHHAVVEKIKEQCRAITNTFASKEVVFAPRSLSYPELAELVNAVFIGLHGRPGEDGSVQQELEKVGLPYNGSEPHSSQVTINKFDTLQRLAKEGYTVAEQLLVYKKEFVEDREYLLQNVERVFAYPLIAKPVDDGCSSAVKLIKDKHQLVAYLTIAFRSTEAIPEKEAALLKLHPKEEFPQKEVMLIEQLIDADGAESFMEVTVGLVTHLKNGELTYEVFEPSEALATGEVLSLEEKFLAGEGQNITPARFGNNQQEYEYIAGQVKKDIERAATILGVTGYARIDAFVRVYDNNRAETIVIEVNSLPGMTPATCIFHQAAINGYKPFEFIDQILEFGLYERTTQ